MKKMLLMLLVIITYLQTASAQQVVFVSTVFRNTTTNPCTITVQLGLDNKTSSCNGNSGAGVINVVDLNFSMNWNPSLLTLVGVTFIPTGQRLDDAGHFSGSSADNGTPATNPGNLQNVSYNTYGTFSSFNFQRSTNLCANTVSVPCGMIVPLFMATFTMDCAASNNYSYAYNTSSGADNGNYIVEFISPDGVPSNDFKEILFEIDQTRSLGDMAGRCNNDGTIKNDNTLTNDPAGNYHTNTQGAILPVQLNDFDVAHNGTKNIISWTTQTELLNKGFEVQKKVNGEFKTIAFVFSQAEGGYSNKPLEYSYKDAAALPGETVFYRLKLVSELGTESFSEIRHVKLSNTLQVRVYPNPSAGWVNISMPDDASQYDIMITDYTGRVFRSYNNLREPLLRVTDLQRGFYHVIATNRITGKRIVEKVIVQ